MRLFVVIAALALPLMEIAVFIKVGEVIGVLPTVGLIILAAIIGLTIIRWQGISVLTQTQQSLGQNTVPVEPVVHGVFLFLAGVLLMIPGFLTDIMAFALLVPPIRLAVARYAMGRARGSRRFSVHVSGGSPFDRSRPGRPGQGPNGPGPVIEGQIVEDLTPPPEHDDTGGSAGDDQGRPSPWRK